MPSEPTPAQQPDGGAELLRECPFCGASGNELEPYLAGVICNRCHAHGPVSDDVATWNRRATIPPASPEREAVYRAVDALIDEKVGDFRAGAGGCLQSAPELCALIDAAARKESANAE